MEHRELCGICESKNLVPILDLGQMPLANAFLKKEEIPLEKKYPLSVHFCRRCYSVQLLDIVDPKIVFKKYEYLTSASKPLSDHFVKMGNDLVDQFIFSPNDLVVEIGGNDGVLLEAIKDRCKVLNIDPAINAAHEALKRGVHTVPEFFDIDVAMGLLVNHKLRPRLVIANNVMAHIEDIQNTMAAVGLLIQDLDGVFVFEVHWVGNLIGEGGFDQIYHEHIYYHSLKTLQWLTRMVGMEIFDVELVPIHGQSIRVFVAHNRKPEPSVDAFLKMEEERGLHQEYVYLSFFDKIFTNKQRLKGLLSELKGRTVGYGAPAKGNTLLNYFEIDLDYIVDTTQGKQGLYTPGRHIPVYSPDRLKEEPPDNIVILAWNYADAILEKEKALRDRGVKFIIPVPEVRVV